MHGKFYSDLMTGFHKIESYDSRVIRIDVRSLDFEFIKGLMHQGKDLDTLSVGLLGELYGAQVFVKRLSSSPMTEATICCICGESGGNCQHLKYRRTNTVLTGSKGEIYVVGDHQKSIERQSNEKFRFMFRKE